jgi:cytochrome b pre-mRNA-processing protein 3
MGLLRFLSARDRDKAGLARKAAALYAAAVARAREPAFYTALGVPDTVDGRFELIVLHMHLICRRLRGTAEGTALAQAVFDAMFRDMDRNLREMGVGDPSMPRRVKAMIEAYYGRAQAYDAALGEGGTALERALARNVFNAPGADEGRIAAGPAALAAYVRAAAMALASQAELLAGSVRFPPLAPAASDLG